MISKDLERIIELSSREVTDEEGIEHFNLKNKLEESLEKAEKWDKKLEFLISQGLNEKEAEQFSIGVDKAFIEEAVRLSEENKQLKGALIAESRLTSKHYQKLEKIEVWANVNQVKSGWNGEDLISKIKEILGEQNQPSVKGDVN